MEKLYQALYSSGKYTKSFDEFKTQFGTEEGAKKLYSALNSKGSYTKSFDDFKTQFGFEFKGALVDQEPTAAESKTEQPSFEDQYAAMSEEMMKQYTPQQAKTEPQDAGATVEEGVAPGPISPRMKQRQRELGMDSKLEDGSLEQGLYNPNTPEYIYGAENYRKTMEMYNSRRNDENRMKLLIDGNVDIYEPSIDAGLIKGKTRQIIDSKGLFKDFKPGSIIPESKYNEVISSLIQSDKYITEELPKDLIKANKTKIDEIQKQIESKYDLSKPSNIVKAENEFNQRVSGLIDYYIKNSKTVNKRISTLQNIASQAIQENDYELGREYVGLGDSTIPLLEGLRKGVKQLGLGFKQSYAAGQAEILNNIKSEREKFEDLPDDTKVTYGGEYLEGQGVYVGLKKGTAKQAKEYYDKEAIRVKADLLKSIKGLRYTESELEYFKQGDVDKVFSGDNVFENIQLLVGEQVPNIALARLSFGFGMLAPEFGGAYFDAIYQHLENNGLDINEENILKAIEDKVGDADVAATVGVVNSALEKVGADNIANAMFKGAGGNGIVRIVKDGFKQFVKSGGIKSIGKASARGGFVEYLTEGAQATVNQLGKGVTLDDPMGYIDTNEIVKNAKTGGLIGFILPGVGGAGIQLREITIDTYKKNSSKFKSEKMLDAMAEKAISSIDLKLKDGEINEKEADRQKQEIREVRELQKSVPKSVRIEDREDVINKLIEIKKLKNQNDDFGDFIPEIANRNKDKIASLQKDVFEKIILAEEIQKRTGLGLDETVAEKMMTQNAVIEAVAEKANAKYVYFSDGKISRGDKEILTDDEVNRFLSLKNTSGQYLQGKNIMLINEDVVGKSFAFNVEAHELLHKILETAIGDFDAQSKMIDSVKSILSKKQINTLNERLSERYYNRIESQARRKYKGFPKEKVDAFIEKKKREIESKEFLTVLLDSIRYKMIKFDESIFEKISNIFKRAIKTGANSNVEFDFEKGDQVLDFLKTFVKSLETGKVDERIMETVSRLGDAKTESTGTLESIEDEYADLQDRYDSGEIDSEQYFDLLEDLEKKEFKVKSKDSKKIDSKDFKKILDNIGNNPNGFNFFDEKLESTLRKMVEIKAKNFRTQSGDVVNLENLPGFNMEDFTSEVYFNMMRGKKNKDGSYGSGYIQKFDPSINDSLYGYINAQLANRMNNVLAEGEMTQEKFSSQIQEETFGEIEEYAFDEAIDDQLEEQYREERNLIDPTTIFEDADFYESVTEEIESQFMSTMASDLIFKNTKNLAIKSLAKKLNVRESVIEKASQNLNTTELIDTAPIIAQIADKAIKILPDGAILDKGDGLAVSEKLIGTGTGLPRKILDAYYVKTKRLLSGQEGIGRKGAGLEPFIKRDISKSEFLEALGILEDGTHNPNIKPKTSESQTRRALIDLLGKLMTNTRGRMLMAKEGVPLNEINDFAAGKSEDMFSREGWTIGDVLIEISDSYGQMSGYNERLNYIVQEPFMKSIFEKYGFSSDEFLDEYNSFQRAPSVIDSVRYFDYASTRKTIILSGQLSKLLDPIFGHSQKTMTFTGVFRAFNIGIKSQGSIESLNKDDSKNKLIKSKEKKTTTRLTKESLKSANLSSRKEIESLVKLASNLGTYLKRSPRAGVVSERTSNYLKELKKELKGRPIPFLDDVLREIKAESDYVKQKEIVNESKKDNYARQLALNYYLSLLGDFVHQKNISKETILERMAFVAHILAVDSPSNMAAKTLAQVTDKFSLIDPTTGTSLRIEHLESTSSFNIKAFASIVHNEVTSEIYKASFLDNRVSNIMDKSKDNGGMGIRTEQANVKEDALVSEKMRNIISEQGITEELFSREAEISMMDSTMSNILKKKTGIPVSEQMSRATAKLNADRRNKKFRFMAPSADDFIGFIYSFLGEGNEGDAQMAFFKEKLIDTLNKAYVAMASARQKITRDFKDLNKEYEDIKVSLGKQSGYKKYTNDQVLRAYMYLKSGESNKVLNINEEDAKAFEDVMKSNPRMMEYASYLMELVGAEGKWVSPKSQWTFGSIFEDVERIIDDVRRAEYISEWKENADAIFSENNLNKIESYYGTDFRNALEDMLYRIENGKTIPEKTNKEMSEFQKWLTGSVAVTMFFNTKSAVLQLMSMTNYINWSDNNPIQAAKAFANIPQFSKDVVRIFNSDYLKERRGGLKTEVEAAVLANELRKGGVDGFRGFVNKLLQKGFTFTQIGDSLAISFGGASFYRNRKNSYMSQGISEEQAHEQAWLDFIELTEQAQQSARPDKLSMQQTNSVGRVFLAFQNTPMQYYRLTTRAVQDLVAGRGDFKTNVSKIGYYSFVQGLIFSALQQSLFAFLGDAPDDEEKKEKFESEREKRVIRTVNSTLDTMLRGSGLRGAYVATTKNAILEFIAQEEKGYKADHARTLIELLNLSAPVGIKARTLYQGAYMNYKYNKDIIEDMGFDIDNPGYDIVGSLLSAGVNIPMDKVINDIRQLKEAADSEHDAWQRIALALGWSTWNLGMPNEKIEKLKEEKTKEKKEAAKEKRKKESSGWSGSSKKGWGNSKKSGW